MKKPLLSVAVVLVLVCAPACDRGVRQKKGNAADAAGNSAQPLTEQEKRVKQAIELLDQATAQLKTISDRASATAAAPKLKEIARQLDALHRQGVPLGSEVSEKPDALGRFQRDMEKATERYSGMAVQFVESADKLGSEFQAAYYAMGRLIH
jgi:predicted  nucleic acid-binding Zn-ribbon protein